MEISHLKSSNKNAATQCSKLHSTLDIAIKTVTESKEKIELNCTLLQQKRLKFNKIYKEYSDLTSNIKQHDEIMKSSLREFADNIKHELRSDVDLYFAQQSNKIRYECCYIIS